MSDVLIRGGRVLDPASERDELADVWVRGGRIAAIVPPGTVLAEAGPRVPILEASGLLVCPGFVDLHVSLREPGFEEDECVLTGDSRGAGWWVYHHRGSVGFQSGRGQSICGRVCAAAGGSSEAVSSFSAGCCDEAAAG